MRSILGLVFLLLISIGSACSEDSTGVDRGGSDFDVGAGAGDLPDGDRADPEAGDLSDAELLDGPKSDTTDPGRYIRFVHISDAHLSGGPESSHARTLAAAVASINELHPLPDLVIDTGDRVDYLPEELVLSGEPGPLHLFRDIMKGLETDWYSVAGNHDYYVSESPYQLTSSQEQYDEYNESLLGWPPNYSVTYNGVKFVLTNSMYGPLAGLGEGITGSLGKEQLTWLREELDEGLPAFLFMHHPPDSVIAAGDEDSFAAVIRDYPGMIVAIFSGHVHRYIRGAFEGVPSYTVGAILDGEAIHFFVEYDTETGEFEILNRDDITFEALNEYDCDPLVDPDLDAPEAFIGTTHRLVVTNPQTDAAGLGAYAGDSLSSIPMVIAIYDRDPAVSFLAAMFTMGPPVIEGPNYIAYLDGFPCESFVITFDNPCIESEPIDFAFDIMGLSYLVTEELPDPSWRVRFNITDFWFQAVAVNLPSGPGLIDGLLHANIDGSQAAIDLRMIIIDEYCAGNIAGCLPGSTDDLPACPGEPTVEFLVEIPDSCDIQVGDLSARMVLMLLDQLDEPVHVDANLCSAGLEFSAEPQSGYADPDLFSTEPGMNCEHLP